MHLALFGSSLSAKSEFIQKLLMGKCGPGLEEFATKRGVLMAQHTLDAFIKKEALHDDKTLTAEYHRSIRTLSSGEQRKALIKHLLTQNPDFIILDGAFDMLDVTSRKRLKQHFSELSKEIRIIQLVKRRDDILPFIKHAVAFEENKVIFKGTVQEYIFQKKPATRSGKLHDLPPPPTSTKSIANPLVRFADVNISYGNKGIVRNINWQINKGDFWQLKGPNGSGKTTLLSLITGDNPKAYGQDITLFGYKRGSGESIWDIKKQIGYITPSMTTLFRGWNTVEKMVISGLVDSIGLYNKPGNMQRKLAQQWVKIIGLSDKVHARFSSLNEGEQCMVLIARAMIKHPPLLILDEPTHGLNDQNAAILSELVNKIATEGNTTLIFVSHRDEPGLNPKQLFELVPGAKGSSGHILLCDSQIQT